MAHLNIINGPKPSPVAINMAILTIISHEPDTFIAAFAGSIIFVVSAIDFAIWARISLFAASMIVGLTCSEFFAQLLSKLSDKLFGLALDVPSGVGAVVGAAAAVRLLMYLSIKPKKVGSVFDRHFRKGEK
ncbi:MULTISPECIES: putative holin [Pseudescherichia]|uniref:putative holin n=1 Tax=Pseudescherichia TaxID=2055880 RepID=UPI001EDCC5F8|nr:MULTISPECIES: putative holin [Pseudescherichia]